MHSIRERPSPDISDLTSSANPDKWHYLQNVVRICIMHTCVSVYGCMCVTLSDLPGKVPEALLGQVSG